MAFLSELSYSPQCRSALLDVLDLLSSLEPHTVCPLGDMQIVLCSLDALLESVKILRAHALDTRADVDKIKHQMAGVLVKLCQLRAELLGACL